ncbi:substrate-binding periplasmic protein [Colwellia psychrerythraea]|uniref:ABC-type transporter, periplasmic subunit family 3 n=1 Tax=Colwellia psychrerythraea TaxID=28229 RepID=A0A099KZ25_COLPS|nr:transporter substrate-binding domain-containing protein [Colwellia psychrerythraea]KGJ94898.1 ABC-type transporter, periplasmic subunit family 3 [Colwellia psychrerythraea]
MLLELSLGVDVIDAYREKHENHQATCQGNLILKLFYIFFIIWISLSLSFSCKAIETINLSTFEYPPEHSQVLPHHGVVSHIIELAFAQVNIKVKWSYYPTTRAFMMAKSGRVDGTASYGYSKERIEGMYMSNSIISSATYFYHLKSTDFNWHNIKDLAGLRVGITNKLNYGDLFNNAVKENIFIVDGAQHDDLNLKKLLAGRIDIFPMTSGIAEYALKTRFPKGALEKVTYNKKPIREYDSFLFLPESLLKSEALLASFNQGLQKLQKSGQYQQILSNYYNGYYSTAIVNAKK